MTTVLAQLKNDVEAKIMAMLTTTTSNLAVDDMKA